MANQQIQQRIDRGRLTAADIMARDIFSVRPDTPVRDAARDLAARHISGAPVIDDHDRVVGIITEGDLLAKAAGAPGGVPGLSMFTMPIRRRHVRRWLAKASAETVADIMSTGVQTARGDTPVRELAAMMARNEINRIPIVSDDGALIGIVTRNDVLRIFTRSDADLAAAYRDTLRGRIELSSIDIGVQDGRIRVKGRVERQSDVRLLEVAALSLDGVIGVDTSSVTFDVSDLSW